MHTSIAYPYFFILLLFTSGACIILGYLMARKGDTLIRFSESIYDWRRYTFVDTHRTATTLFLIGLISAIPVMLYTEINVVRYLSGIFGFISFWLFLRSSIALWKLK